MSLHKKQKQESNFQQIAIWASKIHKSQGNVCGMGSQFYASFCGRHKYMDSSIYNVYTLYISYK